MPTWRSSTSSLVTSADSCRPTARSSRARSSRTSTCFELYKRITDDRSFGEALKTIAAFLNTEGGDLLIGVADDGSVVGVEPDQLESDDKFMRHLAQGVRNGLGDRAGTCIDPRMQIVQGRTVCVVSCQRSPEPVFLFDVLAEEVNRVIDEESGSGRRLSSG